MIQRTACLIARSSDPCRNLAIEKHLLDTLSEAFCLYSQRERFKPYEKHHSTVMDAAKLAQQLKVPHLVLWHTEDANVEERKALYMEEAQPYYTGDLHIPDDLEVIPLL